MPFLISVPIAPSGGQAAKDNVAYPVLPSASRAVRTPLPNVVKRVVTKVVTNVVTNVVTHVVTHVVRNVVIKVVKNMVMNWSQSHHI